MATSNDPFGPSYAPLGLNPTAPPPAAVESQKRLAAQKEEAVRAQRQEIYSTLIDAWGSGVVADSIVTAEARTLGEILRARIDDHKRMITALEWFASHVSLDNPGDNTFVTRVILEGLNAMARNRPSGNPW